MLKCFYTVLLTTVLSAQAVVASEKVQMDFLLQAIHPPKGVVFEVVQYGEDDLSWVMPRVHQHIETLRQRFPKLAFAVVSHGNEQFGLLKRNQMQLPAIHQLSQKLVAQQVPVHLCSTHAAVAGFSADDFPEHVDVSMAGPTRVANYLRQGYVLVNIEREKN